MKRTLFFIILFIGLNFKTMAIKIAIGSSPSNLSPFFSTDANSQNINRLLHLSLTDFDQDMELTCRACSSFKEIRENEKQILHFVLKKDLKFWDGLPVTSKDVALSHKYFTEEEKIKSLFRFAFKKIESVKIINDYEFKLIYSSFSPDNLSNLSLFKIIKIPGFDQLKEIGGRTDLIIGAGPYRPKNISELKIDLIPSHSTLSPLSFRVVKDETTLSLKLLHKEIDLSLVDISPRKIFWLKEKEGHALNFHESIGSNYKYIGVNHRNPFLKLQEVRKALSLLIPRELLLKHKLKNLAVLSNGLFSPSFRSLFDANRLVEKYDPVLALNLLKKIGFHKNNDGKLIRNGEPLKLKWVISNNNATLEIATLIKNEFEKVGITINLISQEWGSYMKNLKRGAFDLTIGQWVGFTGGEMLTYIFHSSSIPPKGGNRGFYENSEVDLLLNEAQKGAPMKEMQKTFKKVDLISYEDYAYISLWHPHIIWISRNCLKNVLPMGNGSFLPLLEIKDSCGK